MAVSGALIYIYSNDGLTQLTTFYPVYGGTTTVTITDTGAEYKADISTAVNSGTYTYSGDKVFIGLATSANATEPTYAVGDKFTFPAYASNNLNLYIVEQALPEYTLRIDGVEVTDYENVIVNGVSYKCKQASVPTDLTGYTVTVPAGWSASDGYGSFYIECVSEVRSEFFAIGYAYDSVTESIDLWSNKVCIADGFSSYDYYKEYNSSESFTITITGGTDVTNESLIQWLLDNNATFEKATLISFTIAGTTYRAIEGMTWGEWVSSSYNTGGWVCFDNSNSNVWKEIDYTTTHYVCDTSASYSDVIKVPAIIVADKNYPIYIQSQSSGG